MASKPGSQKKSGQKYQNKEAFKVRFNPKKEEMITKAPLDRLCQRCMDQIQWKLNFGKYKPLSTVGKCQKCHQRTITKAYRAACDKCSDSLKICSKCMESKSVIPVEEKKRIKDGVDLDLLAEMEEKLKRMRERSRRKILRLINKGLVEYEDGNFIYTENGEEVENLKFRDDLEEDYEDISDEDEELDDDEEDDHSHGSDDDDGSVGDDDDDDDDSDNSISSEKMARTKKKEEKKNESKAKINKRREARKKKAKGKSKDHKSKSEKEEPKKESEKLPEKTFDRKEDVNAEEKGKNTEEKKISDTSKDKKKKKESDSEDSDDFEDDDDNWGSDNDA